MFELLVHRLSSLLYLGDGGKNVYMTAMAMAKAVGEASAVLAAISGRDPNPISGEVDAAPVVNL